jgi:long-chain acyl-CoA synthetase
MCTLPFFHVYGQVCCILYGAFTGATLIVLPRFDVDEVFDTLHKFEQINYWPCVPTMLTAIVNHPRATEIDWFKKVDYIVLGAAPSPSQLIAKAEKLDCTFHPGWGMSETASLGICNPYGRPKLNSIGVPFIDVDVRIVDPDTLQDVERGKPGEIWVKSPYVMKGYWNSPEETAKVFTKDGWLRTGDVAYMDEEGYIFIVDRTKDIIIAGGYNIYPNEIDEVLLRHPKVKDAITIGIPDEYRGETVKSFVQLAVGVDCTAEELIAYCRENLAAYKIPRFIEFREELPRTNVGKAMRRLLREEEMAKGKA